MRSAAGSAQGCCRVPTVGRSRAARLVQNDWGGAQILLAQGGGDGSAGS